MSYDFITRGENKQNLLNVTLVYTENSESKHISGAIILFYRCT